MPHDRRHRPEPSFVARGTAGTLCFCRGAIPGALQIVARIGIADEAVILSTCNRVEIYAATSLDAAEGVSRELKQFLVDAATIIAIR